ncbi:MAG: hypothetical protein AMJ93_09380 [Anaerolineae bacterium SM23_84]|jgi:phosphoglycolate phosphatase-like HAD superfamily hydrolase|nr:MAG: hypothetical protein AMJ93_09380 [Anaerolineae bacterium SM23_84]
MKFRTGADLPPRSWLEVVNPGVLLGRVRHAMFDFDGTISVIRRGWQTIMVSMMVEMICGDHPPTPQIKDEVTDYVDRSTGMLTITQMRWLAEAVRRHGLNHLQMSARDYKRIYNERLLHPVRKRLHRIDGSQTSCDRLMIAGARDFLHGLWERGVTLYLASGTDQIHVLNEAAALGIDELFGNNVYGADDDAEDWTKEQIIEAILQAHDLRGEQLLVVGDGPVEIRNGSARRAVTLGVAADEERRQGLDPRKRERLLDAGADLIVTDFMHHEDLLAYLLPHGRQ